MVKTLIGEARSKTKIKWNTELKNKVEEQGYCLVMK